MRLITVVMLACISCSAVISQEPLKKKVYECSRNCDSHFTDQICWTKTFKHFTSGMLQAMIQYKNAALSYEHTKESIESIMKDTINEISELEKKDEKAQVNSIENLIWDIYNNLGMNTTNPTRPQNVFYTDCPVTCNIEEQNLYILLFSIAIGLTVAALFFVSVYTLVFKLKYRKIYETTKVRSSKL